MTVLRAPPPILCRMAMSPDDVAACQALRYACFHDGAGLDADHFDTLSDHVMIEREGVLVCTLRLRVLPDGADFSETYTGGFYDFGPLPGPTIEVGRFCVAQGAFSSDMARTKQTARQSTDGKDTYFVHATSTTTNAHTPAHARLCRRCSNDFAMKLLRTV